MNPSLALIAALVALLIGLAAGKAWERYKLRDGRWVDRRRLRESSHYIVGLNALVSGHIDQAIDEFSKAAAIDPEALEIQIILGNLYREKGQVGRAIQVHQSTLQYPRLTRAEHAHVLLCLGLDFRRGGFIDRAGEAFGEVLRLDPDNEYALWNLEKLYEEQQQWEQAYTTRRELSARAHERDQPRHRAILAFLENEIGRQALARMEYGEAARRFQAAIDLDATAVPAYLNLGDARFFEGDTAGAVGQWERILQVAPERAYLAFERLEAAYPKTDRPGRFPELCRRLIDANPQDWRARLALATHLTGAGAPAEALELLFQALAENPHALMLHQAIWRTLLDLHLDRDLVSRYIELARGAVFYSDPHVCLRCRYRSTELLWHCPQCHEWNSFVEDRIAPAKDENDT